MTGFAPVAAEKMSPKDQTELGDRLGLAEIMYKMDDAAGAKKLYMELLEQYPNNIKILNDLAWILQEHDRDYESAIKLADAALETARDSVALRHILDTRGTILLKMNRSGEWHCFFYS